MKYTSKDFMKYLERGTKNGWTTWEEDAIERNKTATEAKAKLFETELQIKKAEIEHLENIRAMEAKARPQKAMNEFLGGVPYEEVLELIKAKYPENFI